MATAVQTTIETLAITIDKKNRKLQTVVYPGTTNEVRFEANEDCEVHFDDSATFGMAILPLQKNVHRDLPVKVANTPTGFRIWLDDGTITTYSIGPRNKPWPILP